MRHLPCIADRCAKAGATRNSFARFCMVFLGAVFFVRLLMLQVSVRCADRWKWSFCSRTFLWCFEVDDNVNPTIVRDVDAMPVVSCRGWRQRGPSLLFRIWLWLAPFMLHFHVAFCKNTSPTASNSSRRYCTTRFKNASHCASPVHDDVDVRCGCGGHRASDRVERIGTHTTT